MTWGDVTEISSHKTNHCIGCKGRATLERQACIVCFFRLDGIYRIQFGKGIPAPRHIAKGPQSEGESF